MPMLKCMMTYPIQPRKPNALKSLKSVVKLVCLSSDVYITLFSYYQLIFVVLVVLSYLNSRMEYFYFKFLTNFKYSLFINNKEKYRFSQYIMKLFHYGIQIIWNYIQSNCKSYFNCKLLQSFFVLAMFSTQNFSHFILISFCEQRVKREEFLSLDMYKQKRNCA